MARNSAEITKTSRFIILASTCVVVAALYFAQEVLIPLALALLLSFLLGPIVVRLERLKLGRTASVLLVVLSFLGVLLVIGWVVKTQFVAIAEQLPKYREDIRHKLDRFQRSTNPLEKSFKEFEKVTATSQPTTAPTTLPAAAPVVPLEGTRRPGGPRSLPPSSTPPPPSPPATPEWTTQNPMPVRNIQMSSAVEEAWNWLKRLLGPLATTVLVVVLVIFMLIAREDLRDRLIRLMGHGRLNLTTQALDEAATRITSYLFAQAMVNTAYGICVAIGLWLIGRFFGREEGGFPSVLLWALLCALLRFVPYVGIWIAMAFPVLLSFALFKGSGVFIGTIILFTALEVVVGQFVEPYLYGSSTGMSPLAVLVSAVFWTWLWGPVGLLLSTPLTVCLVVVGKYVPSLQFLDIMLGDEPVLEPPVRIYQRLLSLDAEEAAEVGREYLKEHPLEEVYDHVLLPALSMAERDFKQGQIDEERHNFVHQTLRELIEELGDESDAEAARHAARSAEHAAKEQSAPMPISRRAVLPRDCTINVLCLPAKDEADEISCIMLAQLLEKHGYRATAVPAASLAAEMVEMVSEKKANLVCVSAMPPAAVAHARYLCKRLHARFPDLQMVVGLWTLRGDREKARQRITCVDSVRLCITLTEALDQIEQMVPSTVVAPTPSDNESEPVAVR